MGVNLLNVISLSYLKFIEGKRKQQPSNNNKKNPNTPLVLRIYLVKLILGVLPELLRPTQTYFQGEGRLTSTYLRHVTTNPKTNLTVYAFCRYNIKT